MSQQLKPMVAVDQPAETLVYRPISGLAVASVIVAAVYSLVILVLGGMAVYFGDALPLGTWSLLFPLTAGALALMARRQIRLSEGTQSGLTLANWGWWLSVGFGLGYGAIYVGTYLALTWQAQDFAHQFLTQIRDGKINDAFLKTQGPEERKGLDPNNQQLMTIRFGSLLKPFQRHEFVRILQQSGKDAVISDLGVNGWEYDKGYHILQSFRISTPEGDFDTSLSLRSNEDRKARGWRIVPTESDLTASKAILKPYGEALRKWRQDSQMFTFLWLQKRTAGVFDYVFLDTCEPGARIRLLKESRGSIAGDIGLASVLGTGPRFHCGSYAGMQQRVAGTRTIPASRPLRRATLSRPTSWRRQPNTATQFSTKSRTCSSTRRGPF